MWKALITRDVRLVRFGPGLGPWVEAITRPCARAQNASRLRSLRGVPLVHQRSHEGSAAAPCLSAAGRCAMIVSDPCAHTSTSPHSSNADSAAVTRQSCGCSSAARNCVSDRAICQKDRSYATQRRPQIDEPAAPVGRYSPASSASQLTERSRGSTIVLTEIELPGVLCLTGGEEPTCPARRCHDVAQRRRRLNSPAHHLEQGGGLVRSFRVFCSVAGAVFVAAALLVSASGASAAGGVSLCIPEAEGAATVTPTKGGCAANYKLVELGAEGKEGPVGKEGSAGKEGKEGTFAGLTTADRETLLAVLPYIKFVKEGIDKKPTIKFSGANVQVVSGAAKETELDGLGNLIVGNDEEPGTQTGSGNLVLGTFKQSFTSYGGFLAGAYNAVKAGSAAVSGGEYGVASGLRASVGGGYDNTASAEGASASGGQDNKASGLGATVSGGLYNEASATASWVSGGAENIASEDFATVSGGFLNTASGFGASISGGSENKAGGEGSSVSGGAANSAHGGWSSVLGGEKNTANGKHSSILGGKGLTLATEFGEDY